MNSILSSAATVEIQLIRPAFSCGNTNYVDDEYTDSIIIPQEYVTGIQDPIATTAVGDSMTPIIKSGDLIIVEKNAFPANNDVIVCCLDGDCMIKRYNYENERVVLLSDNPKFSSITVKPYDHFVILGVVRRICPL